MKNRTLVWADFIYHDQMYSALDLEHALEIRSKFTDRELIFIDYGIKLSPAKFD